MMLGLLGLMAIDDARPLSLVVPWATGLGPIGVHTVPLRLMSGPPSSLGPHPPAWLPGPASHRLAALLPTQATEATAGGHWRKPPAWPGRLPPDGDRESVGGRRAPPPRRRSRICWWTACSRPIRRRRGRSSYSRCSRSSFSCPSRPWFGPLGLGIDPSFA